MVQREKFGLDEIRLDLLSGETSWLRLPYEEAGDGPTLVGLAADAIFAEYALRNKAGHRRQQLDDWLRPVSYQLLTRCFENDLLLALTKRISANRRRLNVPRDTSNPFHLALFGIFASDKGLVGEKDRSRLGMELWYAHRHFVPWCFVNGFVRQYGPITREKSLSYIEPDVESHIMMNLGFEYGQLSRRGPYPKRVSIGAREMIDGVAQLFTTIEGGVLKYLLYNEEDDGIITKAEAEESDSDQVRR